MFFKNILRITFVLLAAMPFTAFADSLNVKVGAWEMTMTSLMTGMMVPPEIAEKMSPDQRAKMEEALQAYAGKPHMHIVKSCFTKEDLDQDRLLKIDNEDKCQRKIISKSASRIVIEQTCEAPGPSKSTMVMESKNPENIAGTMDMVQAGNNGKVHMDIKGRWLGASCEDIDKNK